MCLFHREVQPERGGVSAGVAGPVPALAEWSLVIGCLPFISFALPLYPSRSPAGAAPSGAASFIAVRSRRGGGGWEGGGVGVLQREASGGDGERQARDCQISAVEYLMEPGVFI